MSGPVEILLHIPACYIEPWRIVPLEGPLIAQEPFLRVPYPMPIGDAAIRTPAALVGLEGPSGHIRQLQALGRAALAVLTAQRPRFHRSRSASGELIEASGTTILVTGYESTARSVIFGSWDAGEDVDAALGRLSEARRILRLPAPVARAMFARTFIEGLPPPQMVLSNVIPIGEREPETCLGGYDEGGAGIPIVMAVGTERIRIVFDHRVYNPPDLVLFRDEFLKELDTQLLRWHEPPATRIVPE